MAPPKLKKGGRSPTAREIEEHAATGHAVFRDWCPFCCQARGVAVHHGRSPDGRDTEGDPVVSIDFAFMTDPEGSAVTKPAADSGKGLDGEQAAEQQIGRAHV